MTASLNSNMRLLLPPPTPSQITQSNLPAPSQMSQSNFSAVQTNYVERLVEMLGGGRGTGVASQMSQSNLTAPRGWVGVSGVKGSGKTTALLQACHILAAQAQGPGSGLTPAPGPGRAQGQGLVPGLGTAPGQGQGPPTSSGSPSRDFVWVDLAGVSSDMEVISRVAQQLGLAQQVREWVIISLVIFSSHPHHTPRRTIIFFPYHAHQSVYYTQCIIIFIAILSDRFSA